MSAERKQAFMRTWYSSDLYELEDNYSVLNRLALKGLAPAILGFVDTQQEQGQLLLERIEGFDLASIPLKYRKFSYSNQFALQLAQLYEEIYISGLVQDDAHLANYMYDTEHERFVVVDYEYIREKQERHSKRDIVRNYARNLACIYLKADPVSYALYLDRQNWLDRFLTEKELREYRSDLGMFYWEQDEKEPLLEKRMGKIVRNRFEKKGIDKKVDPRILNFICRAYTDATCPEDFSEIFAIAGEMSIFT